MSSKKKSQTPTSNKQPQDEALRNSGKGYRSDEFYNQLDEEKERLLGDIDEAMQTTKPGSSDKQSGTKSSSDPCKYKY